jgi:hypothetical protein
MAQAVGLARMMKVVRMTLYKVSGLVPDASLKGAYLGFKTLSETVENR